MNNKNINHKITALKTHQELFDFFFENENYLDEVNLSILLSKLQQTIGFNQFFFHKQKILKIVFLIPNKDFKPRNIASLLNTFSKWPLIHLKDTLQYLVKKIADQAHDFEAQGIAITLNALSKWPKFVEENRASFLASLKALLANIPTKAKKFNAQDIAMILNALSKWPGYLQKNRTPFLAALKALLDCIPSTAKEFTAQHIAMTLNVLRKWPGFLKENRTPLLAALKTLVNYIPIRVDKFNAQGIAMTLNALSIWPEFLENNTTFQTALKVLMDCIPNMANEFNAQDIANTLNALSKWPEFVEENRASFLAAFKMLLDCIPNRAKGFNAQYIANILNALSKWPELVKKNRASFLASFEVLVDCIPIRVDGFNAQGIANTLNALSKWPEFIEKNHTLFQESLKMLMDCIPNKAEKFNAQDIANTLNALSKWPEFLQKNRTPFLAALKALLNCIPDTAKEFKAQEIAMTLNALSKWPDFIEKDHNLFREMQAAIIKLMNCMPLRAEKFNAQGIASVALTYCVFDFFDVFKGSCNEKIQLSIIIDNLIKYNEIIIQKDLDLTGASFYQIMLYKPHLISLKLGKAIKDNQVNLRSIQKFQTSKLQKEVFNHLKLVKNFTQIEFKEEFFIEFSYVDIVCQSKKILIQINGPTHYIGKKLNLSSEFNNYLYQKRLGWGVTIIPYFEWNKLADCNSKKDYLENKLSDYLNPSVATDAKTARVLPNHKRNKVPKFENSDRNDRKKRSISKTKFNEKVHRNQHAFVGISKTKNFLNKNNNKITQEVDAQWIWKKIVKNNPILEQVRSDELQTAYFEFEKFSPSVAKQLKSKHADDCINIIADKLKKAIYVKKFELLSRNSLVHFFQCKPCRYGLRLKPDIHSATAFTVNQLEKTFKVNSHLKKIQ